MLKVNLEKIGLQEFIDKYGFSFDCDTGFGKLQCDDGCAIMLYVEYSDSCWISVYTSTEDARVNDDSLEALFDMIKNGDVVKGDQK